MPERFKEILAAYGEVADPWKLAAWFHFPNGWLGEAGPQGMVPLVPKDALDQGQAVVEAARKRLSSYVA